MQDDATRILVSTNKPKPRTGGDACLVHIYPTGPGMGSRYPLGDSPVVLGRDDDCHIHLTDDSVSRKHACIQPETDGYTVSRHLDVIEAHVGGNLFDYVIVNSNNAPPLSAAALEAGIHRVPFDRERAAQRPLHYILADVVSLRITTHHDPEKLARVIMKRVWR